MEHQRRESHSLTTDFSNREIIVGSLCGNVYFIDYITGRASRQAFEGKNPIKGSVSLDPRLNGNLYIGHGIPAADNSIGAVAFNMFNHKRLSYFGRDSKAWRRWGAYDPAAVVVDNFMIRVSENGTIYKFTTDGKENPYLAVMVSVLGVCAQLEREAITFRLNSGLKRYRDAGGRVGRKAGSVKSREKKQEEYAKVIRSLKAGKSIRDTAAICGVSVSTVQRVKKDFF
jgi:hypothetical protein